MAKPLAKLVALLTPKRRWAQFSLASMFVVMTVFCVGLRLVVSPAERQRRAVAAIKALYGSMVGYVEPNQEEPDQKATEAFPRQFLRRWLPQDYFDDVRTVILTGIQLTDDRLAHLQRLTGLQLLYLDRTQITDAGLAHLQGLTELKWLKLSDTQVTDAGLAHLQGLAGLQRLDLNRTQVTDAGLVHLQGLTGLQVLHLDGTQVSDAGLVQLRQALPNCAIYGP